MPAGADSFPTEERERLSEAVLPLTEWYTCHKKDYPWRQSPTPYHVWISEIMLQQTRIEAALPYYERFLEAFPDIASLAKADEERLMKLWQGLGYYSRARHLKKTAEILIQRFGGELPDSAAELKKLPGIGDYTAGAIASIAYHLPVPAVDGNVLRVVMRLLARHDDVMLPETRRYVTNLLTAVYPSGERAALLTEGLMELGETVCVPAGNPRCQQCPVKSVCAACEKGLQTQLPLRKKPAKRRVEERTVLLLHHEGRYALHRGERGCWQACGNFPDLTDGLPVSRQKPVYPKRAGSLSRWSIAEKPNTFFPMWNGI